MHDKAALLLGDVAVGRIADALLRGAIEERFSAYRVAREWGWMSVNEIREKENQNGIGPEGDTYREPMNTQQVAADVSAA